MVYVDELIVWSHAKHGCFMNGSSHLEADTLTELHDFAVRKLGLKREWFQSRSSPHYDLSPAKRELALRKGAVFRTGRESSLIRGMTRHTEDFQIISVIGVETTWLARWVYNGVAFEMASAPGEGKIELLGNCFRELLCLRGIKTR